MRRFRQSGLQRRQRISIHASRVGCDHYIQSNPVTDTISIHASHVGCDNSWESKLTKPAIFQSTHPVWDATQTHHLYIMEINFNPRIPCGMRRPGPRRPCRSWYFNPRIPCGMRPSQLPLSSVIDSISIHASRVGCDWMYTFGKSPAQFQSTHPVWDATLAATAFKRH